MSREGGECFKKEGGCDLITNYGLSVDRVLSTLVGTEMFRCLDVKMFRFLS